MAKCPLRKEKELMGINIRRTIKRREVYKKLMIDKEKGEYKENDISDKDILKAIVEA